MIPAFRARAVEETKEKPPERSMALGRPPPIAEEIMIINMVEQKNEREGNKIDMRQMVATGSPAATH